MRAERRVGLVFFKSVELIHFRNYQHERFALHPRFNVLVGANGQGKTNFLEALYVFGHGQSFRAGNRGTLLARSQPLGALRATLGRGEYAHAVAARISQAKLEMSLDGKIVPRKRVAALLPMVLFSPESLTAIKEAPEHRRRLIDEVLWMKGEEQIDCIESFQRVLRARNKLLKDFKLGKIAGKTFAATLASLDEIYIPVATRLTWERLIALHELHRDLHGAYVDISVDSGVDKNVDIHVDYEISGQIATAWSYPQLLASIRGRLHKLSAAEVEAGMTLVGPHKHDVRIVFDGNDSRYYCSQGQQRSLILAFKMAQIMYHGRVRQKRPLLLLDDVLSELDAGRQRRLLRFLRSIDAQIFLTTAEISNTQELDNQDTQVFSIRDGKIQQR